jgi:hypothetical protein
MRGFLSTLGVSTTAAEERFFLSIIDGGVL